MTNYEYYFDYAAATPLLPEAQKAMQPFWQQRFYNPSALYLGARENHQTLETARHTIAEGLGARPTEIIFTAGGTEANNLAIRGVLEEFKNSSVITCAIEHDSVLQPAKLYNHNILGVDNKGFVQLNSLKKAISDETVLVSIMYANNEIGTIEPIKEIIRIIGEINTDRQKRHVNQPLYLHSDACQAANYLDMQVSRLGVDLMTINAGKIYGPKQCGTLYVRSGVKLKPLILGGGQEWNKRSGTENLANIVGFAKTLSQVRKDYKTETIRLANLRDGFLREIAQKLPSVVINGPADSKRLANNIHITIPNQDNERLTMLLDEIGIQVANGSACSASSDEPSHVLKAIGLTDKAAQSSLRITLGRYTTKKSLKDLSLELAELVALN